MVLYRFNLDSIDKNLQVFLDSDGVLKKHVSTPGTSNPKRLEFLYKDIDRNNKPILVKDVEMKNRITSSELNRIKDFDELVKFFNNITNIYIVEGVYFTYKDYYIAKKVSFKEVKGGL